MNIIKIEHLSFDAKVEREAMNAIVGGWAVSSYYKNCVKLFKFSSTHIRQVGRTGRRAIRKTSSIIRKIRSWF